MLAHYRYADRLLSLDTGAATQYYHFDALGSTVNLTTETASVQVSYKLDPWGHIKSQTGTSVNRKIFTGQEHDENTGLIYFGARYYDPDTARFITQDSYLGEQNTPPSLHRYLYAYSNPTVYVDLYGYEAVKAQNENNAETSLLRRIANWLVTEEVVSHAEKLITYITSEDETGSSEDKKIEIKPGLNKEGLKDAWVTSEPSRDKAAKKIDTAIEFGTGSSIEEIKETIENPNAENVGTVGGMYLIGKLKWIGKTKGFLKRKKDDIFTGAKSRWNKVLQKFRKKGDDVAEGVGDLVPKSALKFGSEDLVLGLNKGGSLQNWTKQFGGKTFGKFELPKGSFDKQIRSAMYQSKHIRVNLDDVDLSRISGKLNEFGEPLRGNYTNYELYLIKNNSVYLNKTNFYKGGVEVPSPF